MTRDETIRKHRAMWRWIAEQIESQKKRLCIPRLKDIYCRVNGDEILLTFFSKKSPTSKVGG